MILTTFALSSFLSGGLSGSGTLTKPMKIWCQDSQGNLYETTGTSCPNAPGAPGPLTIAGVTAALYQSRKLRNRIKGQ